MSIRQSKSIFLIFNFLVFFIIGCASTAPLPETLNIVPPLPDVPTEIAAFSGGWEGKLGYQDRILVVETINTDKAEVIVSWGIVAGTNAKAWYQYMEAKILPGPAIQTTDTIGNKTTYKMNKELNNLTVIYEEKPTGVKLKGKLTRVTDFSQIKRGKRKKQNVSSPLPEDVTITSPPENTPREIAAFSGKWEGVWNNYVDGMLVIERIDKLTADIIISWGEVYGVEKGYLRATVDVQPGPTLEHEDKFSVWTFTMNQDLNSVSGVVLEKAVKSKMKVVMKRAN